jgi:hypothetical protein
MSHYDQYRAATDKKEGWEMEIEQNDAPYEPKHHIVDKPAHYKAFDKECITLIAASCTQEEFRGYCYGCWLKYRFRMGSKESLTTDYAKSEKYKDLYEKHKHLCTDTPF